MTSEDSSLKDDSFPKVDVLEGPAELMRVGDTGAVRGDNAFSAVTRGGPSVGVGSVCITLNNSLFVRIAAVWIIKT
jgi:hypothetical protein